MVYLCAANVSNKDVSHHILRISPTQVMILRWHHIISQ